MVDAVLLDPIANLIDTYIAYLPNLVGALILLILGLVIGRAIGRIVFEIIERSTIEKYIMEKGAKIKLSNFFSVISRWGIYLVFIKASSEQAGIPALASFVGRILNFVFGVIEAVVIMLVGYLIASYAQDQVKNMRIRYSDLIANVVFFFVLYIGIALALPFAGINVSLVNNVLLAIIGAVALGIAIAIGLGLKDVVAEVAREYIKEAAGRKKE